MYSLAAPLIKPIEVEQSRSRYEAFPPWLISMLVHMGIVIALGLIHISTNPGSELKLLFLPAELSDETTPEASGLADLEVNLDVEPVSFSQVDDEAAPISETEALASLETDWQSLVPHDGGLLSSIPGVGEGAASETSGGGGGNSVTSLFGLSGEGGKFVYVFDRSESMNSIFTLLSGGRIISSITPLRSAKMEMARSLGKLRKENEFQIVFYNDGVEVFKDEHYGRTLFRATEENKRRANDFIEQMPGEGFTDHLLALDTAFDLDPEVIFLLTDGEAKDDPPPSVVRRMYKYCQREHIVINIVHFCDTPRRDCTLIQLAEKTGGHHVFITLQSLAEALVNPVAM